MASWSQGGEGNDSNDPTLTGVPQTTMSQRTLSMTLGDILRALKSKHRLSVTGPSRHSAFQEWSSYGQPKCWENMVQHPAHPPLGA